jgi:hypothetical protein
MYIIIIDYCVPVGIFFTVKECEEFIKLHKLQKHAIIAEMVNKTEYPTD